MSTAATRVTEPGGAPVDPSSATAQAASMGAMLINPVGPGALDGPRMAAREALYGNSELERKTIAAYDDAAFDRVRRTETSLRESAETSMQRNAKHVETAENVAGRLLTLAKDLRRGKVSVEDAATEYQRLQALAKDTQSRLERAAHEAARHTERLSDPYAATQNLIAKMPRSSFVGLDPSRFIR